MTGAIKRNKVKARLGQSIAQMLGAEIFNQNEGNEIELIDGYVVPFDRGKIEGISRNLPSVTPRSTLVKRGERERNRLVRNASYLKPVKP